MRDNNSRPLLDYWIIIDVAVIAFSSIDRISNDKVIDQIDKTYDEFKEKMLDEKYPKEKLDAKSKKFQDIVYKRLDVLKEQLKTIELGSDTYSMTFRILHNKAFDKMGLED